MTRRLAVLLFGLVLSTAFPAAAQQGPVAAGSQSTAAQAPAAGKVIQRRVRLGHKPVRYASERRTTVRLTFQGHRGQLVNLARTSFPRPCGKRVLFGGGKRVRPWAAGHWRLPRTGTYTAVARPCPRSDSTDGFVAQVRRVVVRKAPQVDGRSIKVGRDRNATHLVRVRLRGSERLNVHGNHQGEMILPDRTTAAYLPRRIVLEAGSPIGHRDQVDRAGNHWLVASPRAKVRVTRAAAHRAQVDDPALVLDNDGVAAREHVVSFTGRAGQWVHPEIVTADGDLVAPGSQHVTLLGPDKAPVRGVATTCGGRSTARDCFEWVNGPWQVPTDGTYRLSVVVGGSGTEDRHSLRVRAAAEAEPLTLDGPAVTFTSATPGQWVVGSMPQSPGSFSASASDVSPGLADWRVSLLPGLVPACSPEDTTLGCGDYFGAELTPRSPTNDRAYVYGGGGPDVVVMSVPPTVSGSLRVSLRSR